MKLNPLYFVIFTAFAGYIAPTFASNSLPLDLNNECSQPKTAWIWCDDFEVDRSADYFEGSTDRKASLGVNGSTAAAFHFKTGVASAGAIKVAFGRTPSSYFKAVDSGTSDYRDIYWRMFVYLPSNWVGNGADKLSRATIFSASDWSQAMIAHVWSGGDPGSQSDKLIMDPASGTDTFGNLATTGYNDFANLRWLGAKATTFPVFASANFGKWHCIEAHVKLNDANQQNGIFQLSVNGNLEAQSTNLNWVGSYSSYGINAVLFENYWNNGSPVDQTRYFDNLVISTAPIGCGSQSALLQPKPPTDLAIVP